MSVNGLLGKDRTRNRESGTIFLLYLKRFHLNVQLWYMIKRRSMSLHRH